MGEDIDLTRASAETVAALTEASGALEPSRHFWGALARRVDYFFWPRTVRQAKRAAELIEAFGLPRLAYDEIRRRDGLLGAILEGGAMEGDENMQERWAALLANALTSDSAEVRTAFPRILSELEPNEARLLDRLAANKGDSRIPHRWAIAELGVTEPDLENVERLELIRYELMHAPTYGDMTDLSQASREGFKLTPFGSVFVKACQVPRLGDQ